MTMNSANTREPIGNGGLLRERDEISLVEIVNVFLRHRRLLVFLPLIMAVGLAGWALSQDRTYSATAAFMPQAPDRSGVGAAALARQFGINVGGTDRPGQSPQFYADLVRGRELLRQAVESEYVVSIDGVPRTVTLIGWYDLGDDQGLVPPWRRSVERLRRNMSVSVGSETGVVHVAVSAHDPELAEQVVARLVQLLNTFNLETRQSQALEEGRFVAARMAEAHDELRAAEEALKTFLQQNRQFANSPELAFEHDRLQRQVGMRQEVYTALVQSHEQTRIDAVRDTPLITMIANPEGSAEPEPRGTVLRGVLGLMLGFLVAVLTAFVLDFGRRTREDDRDEIREFNRLKREAWSDLRHPTRLLPMRREPAKTTAE